MSDDNNNDDDDDDDDDGVGGGSAVPQCCRALPPKASRSSFEQFIRSIGLIHPILVALTWKSSEHSRCGVEQTLTTRRCKLMIGGIYVSVSQSSRKTLMSER